MILSISTALSFIFQILQNHFLCPRSVFSPLETSYLTTTDSLFLIILHISTSVSFNQSTVLSLFFEADIDSFSDHLVVNPDQTENSRNILKSLLQIQKPNQQKCIISSTSLLTLKSNHCCCCCCCCFQISSIYFIQAPSFRPTGLFRQLSFLAPALTPSIHSLLCNHSDLLKHKLNIITILSKLCGLHAFKMNSQPIGMLFLSLLYFNLKNNLKLIYLLKWGFSCFLTHFHGFPRWHSSKLFTFQCRRCQRHLLDS